MQTKKALEALQTAAHKEVFESQFQLLLNRLAAWARGTDNLKEVRLTLSETGFLLLAITRDDVHSRELEDALSELDLEITQNPDLDMVRLDVMSIPGSESALKAFLNPNLSMVLTKEASQATAEDESVPPAEA